MKIEFSAKNTPHEWFDIIANGFGTQVNNNNTFRIPSSTGEGFGKQIYFFEGLTLTYFYFHKLFEPLEFIRHSQKESRLFPIMFYCQDKPMEQNIGEIKKLIGYHTSNGIFMPSPEIESTWKIPQNIKGFQVSLTLEKEWFLKTSNYSDDIYLNRLLKSKKPFYLFESLHPSMKNIIYSIHKLITSDNKFQQLKLHQISMELFNLFIDQVEHRSSKEKISGLNASDIETLFLTRKQLLENLTNPPSLKQLSLNAGMSISKLQKCFRQVFGKSISQYALTEKMELAKQLLDTKKYSVSEVGYTTGYSNLSHFTKAFHKEYGINPKAYLNSI